MLPVDHLKKADPKMRILIIGVLIGMGILAVGLWRVQIYASKRYWKDLRQQSYRTILIPAARGKILDRNGFALAANRPSYDINLYLGEIRTEFQETYLSAKKFLKSQDPELSFTRDYLNDLQPRTRYLAASNLVARLGDVMDKDIQLNQDALTTHFNQRRSLPMAILKDVEHEETARFLESLDVPNGFELDRQPLRRYPFRETAAQFLGYLATRKFKSGDPNEPDTRYRLKDYEGASGLEKSFDSELRGKPGVKTIKVDSMNYSRAETITTAPVPGDSLVLTIDLPLQLAVENALASVQPDVRGAAVVMNPRNGDIWAMASLPSYDPNLCIPFITHEYWAQLNDGKRKPMRNRASEEIQQPASIFKIVVGLAMLENRIGDPDAFIKTEYRYRLGRTSWKDTAPAGMYDFERAFKRSSNYYFIEYGLQMGRAPIVDMARRFHLGEATSLPTGQNSAGTIPTDDFVRAQQKAGNPWTDGDTANMSIGQGDVYVTPLQMAVMVSAVANGGTIYSPRLVLRLETQADSGAEPLPTRLFPTTKLSDLNVRPENLKRIRKAMLADVADKVEGTGWQAAVPGMEIGGKTGTAEITDTRNYVWFASISPVEDAKYAVVVMVEDGKSGGSTCAPVARKIYEAIRQREAGQIPAAIARTFNERRKI